MQRSSHATGPPRAAARARAAFTLVELVIVLVVLTILVAVAVPRFLDFGSDAENAADRAAIASISSALTIVHLRHRVNASTPGEWIDSVDDIPGVMHLGMLPEGITIDGAKLRDRRGHTYSLTAESAAEAAKLSRDPGSGGGP